MSDSEDYYPDDSISDHEDDTQRRRSKRLMRRRQIVIHETDERMDGSRRSRRLLLKRRRMEVESAETNDDEDNEDNEDELLVRPKKRCIDEKVASLPPPPFEVRNYKDLLELSRLAQRQAFQDCGPLGRIYKTLRDLDTMVGIEDIKEEIVTMVLCKCQRKDLGEADMDHIVIAGDPGCGKTTLAEYLAKINAQMGDIRSGKVVRGTKANMGSKWVNDTAPRVEKLIDEAAGGTLLLDEAYGLGKASESNESGDSGTMDIVNTLNRKLSEACQNPKKRFLCIVIGYEKELERNFFSLNPGLKRRFTWYFKMRKYKPPEMHEIAMRGLRKRNFTVESDDVLPLDWFSDKMAHFPFAGGDVDRLLDMTRKVHARRVFGMTSERKRVLTTEDLHVGFRTYMKYRSSHPDTNDRYKSMYL